MKKKIVIVGTAHPYRGGLAVFNERLARQWISEGHEVEIFTFTLQYPSVFFPGKTQYANWEAPQGLKISRKINSVNPLSWIMQGFRIRKMRPDMLVFKFWMPFFAPCFGTIARSAKYRRSLKVISVLDNVIPHEKRIGDSLLISYFVKAVDGFIAMSKSVGDDLRVFDKNKPCLLSPHPLYDNFGYAMSRDEALKQLGFDPSFRYLLFFGIIRRYKGLDLLLEAFADARLRNFKLKLIIAGEFYEDEKYFLDIVDKYRLSSYIHLHNFFIPDSEVGKYFCAADLIAQPYRSATQSGVTQIAFHFEIPMLVTNVGGLSEVVKNGKSGYVVEPQPLAIADGLVDFFEHSRHASMIENVKVEKKAYGWDIFTQNIEKLYNQIV